MIPSAVFIREYPEMHPDFQSRDTKNDFCKKRQNGHFRQK